MDSTPECQIDPSITSPPWGELGRSATLGLVSGLGKLLLNVMNSTTVINPEAWSQNVMHRAKGTGLITIANHTSLFDDPGIFSAITPWSYFWSEPSHHGMRWSMCAKEVCFKTDFLRQFFQSGKVMPIIRGGGIDQPVMRSASGIVAQGGWLHVFPEGRVMMNGKLGPFRWGVGKVICDARKESGGKDPIVLPFFHSNMASVLPIDSSIPRLGNKVVVTIGDPLDLSDVTCDCHKEGKDQHEVWKQITMRMHDAMRALEASSPPNPYQRENPPGRPGEAFSSSEAAGTSDARLAGRA